MMMHGLTKPKEFQYLSETLEEKAERAALLLILT
jgi:hypothetical protein